MATSPSIRESPAPRWASPAPPAARKVRGLKRNLHAMQDELDAFARKGEIKDGTRLALSNRLMAIHQAQAGLRKRHVEEYLIEAISESPFALMNVPFDDYELVQDPRFLRRLLTRKRSRDGAPIKDDWMDDFMEGMIPEWAADPKDPTYGFLRAATIVSLETRFYTLESVERRLDKLKLTPATLFPIEGEYDGEGELSAWEAVAAEPRFARWLLKPGHDYTEEQVAKLREWAIDMSNQTAERDQGWRDAVGLPTMHDVIAHRMHQMLGQISAEARASAA